MDNVQLEPAMEAAKPGLTAGQQVAIYVTLGLVSFGLGAVAYHFGRKWYLARKAKKAAEAETRE